MKNFPGRKDIHDYTRGLNGLRNFIPAAHTRAPTSTMVAFLKNQCERAVATGMIESFDFETGTATHEGFQP